MGTELTATEAAARLGVRRETLYAYVSRGLVHRRVADDGRTSVFDADEIDRLRAGRRRRAEGEVDALVATAITDVTDGAVRVRGHDLVALVDAGAGFEGVVARLWDDDAEGGWVVPAEVAAAIDGVQAAMPAGAPLLDRLRVSVSVVSAADPLRHVPAPAGVRAAARRMIAGMVHGLPRVGPDGGGGIAGRLWGRLSSGEPTPARVGALDTALALLADHGLATSTFAARLAASVRADPYSMVAAGLGALGGPLHGAASRAVHELLAEAADPGDVADALGARQRRGEGLPGFGHPVHTVVDPREVALAARVRTAWAGDPRLAVVDELVGLITDRTAAVANVDLALGALTHVAGMAPDAGEVVFAVARTAGWIAHGLEELGEEPLRFRPRARWTGPRPRAGEVSR